MCVCAVDLNAGRWQSKEGGARYPCGSTDWNVAGFDPFMVKPKEMEVLGKGEECTTTFTL